MPSSETTVLLGWELGLGFGHVRRLAEIADRLIAQGCKPVFALRHPALMDLALPGHGYTIVQAPGTPPISFPRPNQPLAGFADIIATFGFGDAEVLAHLVEAWDTLLRDFRPSLVICDYSPSLCLAAAGLVPSVVIGDGFTLPPPEQVRFPVMAGRVSGCASEEQMLDHVTRVQRRRGLPVPPTLPSLLTGHARFVCTLPELDPYRTGRLRPADGPLLPLARPQPLPDLPRIFAYVGTEFSVTDAVVDALAMVGVPAAAYVRGATPEHMDRMRGAGVQCFAEPPDLRSELAASSLIIHHGGIATAETALCMGRPQMILWHHLEQCLNARSVFLMGTGPRVNSQFRSAEQIAELVRAALADGRLAANATERAQAIVARGQTHCLDAVVAACLDLLA